MRPKVTVVVSFCNQKDDVKIFIEDILLQDYPQKLLEVLLVDRGSTDGTANFIREYMDEYPFIDNLYNEGCNIPEALNMGIDQANGEAILIMNGSSRYYPNYISTLINNLISTKADKAGGIPVNLPADHSLKALAITLCMSLPFGVGKTTSNPENDKITETDTLGDGCYQRRVFNEIGFFNISIETNFEEELDARLKKQGGRILLVPEVKIQRYTPGTVSLASKVFYQYGYYAPLLLRKTHKFKGFRQFVPPLMILGLITGWISSLVIPDFLTLFFLLIFLHFLIGFCLSVRPAVKNKKIGLLYRMPYVFFIIHGSYGWGYLSGIIRFWLHIGNKPHHEAGSSRYSL